MKPIMTFLLALCSATTAAQDKVVNLSTPCCKNLPIDEFLLADDAATAKVAFEELRVALLGGNKSRVIALLAFPADLVLDGRGVKFDTAQEFEKQYEKVFTAYVTNSVREQDPANLEDVLETISSVDETGRELEKASAITALSGESSLTYAGLHCFEANQQFFETLGPLTVGKSRLHSRKPLIDGF